MTPAEIARQAIGLYDAQQQQWELAMVLNLLDRAPPKLILEIGCWSGGTLWAWRQTGADVIGVTHPQHANILRPHGAEILLADSHFVRGELAALLDGRVPGFVFIDGDHSYGMARSDWELARELAPGAIIGFHDIACPGEPGPARAFAEAARDYPAITIIWPGTQQGTGLVFT